MSSDAAAVDRLLAVELLAVDPSGLGGAIVEGGPSRAREQLVSAIQALQQAGAPFPRLPLHITDDRLFGGLSLPATLHGGRPVYERGFLAQAHGGVVVATSAERLRPRVVAALCGALDRRVLTIEREGQSGSHPCAIALVALDEGQGEERVAPALADRLAFRLRPVGSAVELDSPRTAEVAAARARLDEVVVDDASVEALCAGALALGVDS